MIERVSAAHAEVLAAIHAQCYPPDEAWSSTVFGLQLEVPTAFCLFDTRGGLVLARVVLDESEIVTLAVAPAVRRQGLAEALLRAARDQAWRQGADKMFLEVDVNNTAARALYDKLGFQPIGRRAGYYASGADALVMRADRRG